MPSKTSKPSPKTSPRDFFMHLLVFGALYASAISFLALIFAYVNVLFPDNLGFNYYHSYGMDIITPSSILIIIFPVFILFSWLLAKDLKENSGKREMKFRKWLVYLTLFITAVTIIIDLISLVSAFYHGELTKRFIFKILSVLAVSAGIFWYYFLDLKSSSSLKPKLSAWIASALVLVVIAAGFFIVGTPAQQRAKRFDERRISDLQTIQNQLINYWMQKEELPEQLGELAKDQLSGFIVPSDPETGLEYKYGKLTAFSFELCADFKMDSQENQVYPYPAKPVPLRFPKDQASTNWSHGPGEVCFERTIDPELYKKPLP